MRIKIWRTILSVGLVLLLVTVGLGCVGEGTPESKKDKADMNDVVSPMPLQRHSPTGSYTIYLQINRASQEE